MVREDLVSSAVSRLSRRVPARHELMASRLLVSTAPSVASRPSSPSSAVLQDPSVASAPIEKRIAFLQSKNLTQEEVDAALARAGGEGPPPSTAVSAPSGQPPQPYGYQQPPPPPGYGAYPGYWQQPPPPP